MRWCEKLLTNLLLYTVSLFVWGSFMSVRNYEINTVEDFENLNSEIEKRIKDSSPSGTENWRTFYRGEAKKYNDVNASIFRDDFLFNHEGKYLNFLRGNDEVSLNALGKIQHYGGCTRLLDFSKDLNVALYMACCAHDCEDGYIYCYNTNFIDNESDPICDIIKDYTFYNGSDLSGFLSKLADNYGKTVSDIVEILKKDYFLDFDVLKDGNLRIQRQSGLFLWMGDTNLKSSNANKEKAMSLSDEDGRGSTYPGVVVIVKIAHELKEKIRDRLENPKIYTKGDLFPDEPKNNMTSYQNTERHFFESFLKDKNKTKS